MLSPRPSGAAPARAPSSDAPLPLRHNFSWTLLGNVAWSGCQWGLLVVLAKLGSPDLVGLFVLGLAVANPITILASLDLRLVQATDAAEEFQFGDYFAMRLALLPVAFVVIAAVAFSMYGRATAMVVVAVGLVKVIEAVSDLMHGLFQHRERMDRIGRSLSLRGASGLAAMVAGVVLTRDVLWSTLAMAGATALSVLLYDLPAARRLAGSVRPRWNAPTLRRLLALSLPMGFVASLVTLMPNVPRYFLAHYGGTRELGLFAAVAYLMVVGSTIKTALDQSLSPRLSQLYLAGDRAAFLALLARMIWIALVIGVGGVVVAAAGGRWLLTLFYTHEYARASGIFVLLMLSGALGHVSSSLRFAITAARRFMVQLWIYVGTVVALVLACALLVPRWHMAGAAWAMVAGSAFQLVASVLATYTVLRTAGPRGRRGAVVVTGVSALPQP